MNKKKPERGKTNMEAEKQKEIKELEEKLKKLKEDKKEEPKTEEKPKEKPKQEGMFGDLGLPDPEEYNKRVEKALGTF